MLDEYYSSFFSKKFSFPVTRGIQIGHFLMEALAIAIDTQAKGGKKLSDFRDALQDHAQLRELKEKVAAFATPFPMPGAEVQPPKAN